MSFSRVLFYGQESTLLLFELLFYAAIDIGTTNYVLDAIITFILMEVNAGSCFLLFTYIGYDTLQCLFAV